ncbi:hypothetical protein V8C37DRAFT_387167 [Trichoderma ceciliae]
MFSWHGCEAIGRQKDTPATGTTDSSVFSKKSLLPTLVMGEAELSAGNLQISPF